MTTYATRTKTIQVACYPDGHRVSILRGPLGWRWDRDSWSSHKDAAIANAKAEGATIIREPNPNYQPRLHTFERLMGPLR